MGYYKHYQVKLSNGMKDFFKKDEAMIDLMIVVGIFLFIFISKNVAPLTPTAVMSGQTSDSFLVFLQSQFGGPAFQNFFSSMGDVMGLLAIVLLAGVFWLNIRTSDINKAERKKFAPVLAEEDEAKALQIEWQVILNHVNSESPAEWKLAILEADSMLDEILDTEGYTGDSLGEKLKAMSSSAIHSYDDLWEAHKMRNQIAHEGVDTELTKKMARDTINKFEVAFKELGHI